MRDKGRKLKDEMPDQWLHFAKTYPKYLLQPLFILFFKGVLLCKHCHKEKDSQLTNTLYSYNVLVVKK